MFSSCCSRNFSSHSVGGYLPYSHSSCGSFYPSNLVYRTNLQSPSTCQLGSSLNRGSQEIFLSPHRCQTSCVVSRPRQLTRYHPRTSTLFGPSQTTYAGSLGFGSSSCHSLDFGSRSCHSLGFGSRSSCSLGFQPRSCYSSVSRSSGFRHFGHGVLGFPSLSYGSRNCHSLGFGSRSSCSLGYQPRSCYSSGYGYSGFRPLGHGVHGFPSLGFGSRSSCSLGYQPRSCYSSGCGSSGFGNLGYRVRDFPSLGYGSMLCHPPYVTSRSFQSSCYRPTCCSRSGFY